MVLADAQMENEYASLVRGDQGNEDCSENIPPILLPPKCENEEVRRQSFVPSDNTRILLQTIVRAFDITVSSIYIPGSNFLSFLLQ